MVLNLKTVNTKIFSLNNLKINDILVYDIEVYKNYFLLCYTVVSSEKEKIINKKEDLNIKYIDSREDDFADKIYKLFYVNVNKLQLFIGYNNSRYDNYVIAYIIKNKEKAKENKNQFLQDLKQVSDDIILNNKRQNGVFVNFCSVDVMQELKLNNSSLKDIELRLGLDIEIEDSESFDNDIKDSDINRIIHYCMHDVFTTSVLCMMSFDDNDYYNVSNIYNKLFLYDLYMNKVIKNEHLSKNDFNYKRLLFQTTMSTSDLSSRYFAKADTTEKFIEINKKIILVEPSRDSKNAYEIYTKRKNDLFCKIDDFKISAKNITFGSGGLHTTNNEQLYYYEDVYNFDVTSYYPSFLEIYLNDIANIDLNKFIKTKYERIELKRKKDNVSKSKQNAYKLALNSLTGKFNQMSEYNLFYNPSVYFSMTNSCQLLLLDLCERLEKYVNLVQLNTDGIAFTIKENATISDKKQIIKNIKKWKKNYKFQLEKSKFDRVYERSVNDYIAIYDDNKKQKSKGSTWKQRGSAGSEISFMSATANILHKAYTISKNNDFKDITRNVFKVVDNLIDNNKYEELQFNIKSTATEKEKYIKNTQDNEIFKRTKATRVFLTEKAVCYTSKFKFDTKMSNEKNKAVKKTVYLTFDVFQQDLSKCNLKLSKEKYIALAIYEMSKMYKDYEYLKDYNELINYLKEIDREKKYNFDSISKIVK